MILTSLDMLVIVFLSMSVVSVLGILLLFLLKSEKITKVIFYFLAGLGMATAYMNSASTPPGFMGEVVTGWGLGGLSAVAILVQIRGKTQKSFMAAKILVTVSVLAGIVNLFL